MAVMHPNDQELQRYLNRRCSAKEDRRIGYHIKACSGCRRRISVLLDMEMALEELPVLQAPSDLADRVMSSIEVEASSVHSGRDSGRTAVSGKRRAYWRSELINGLVATAATYLFISTGIVGKLINLDAGELEAGLRSGAIQFLQAVGKVSRHLLF
ncbi:hypothetical protein [Paenibacillus naphthalenovorans]|uniref:hypothetical protein n=1 Tax=Paenibacillus naphthalenovorans TaxID=162209 RepID=UPI0008810B15|nr:hypothetical protein [Paenibacillus naphthalenovorans]SDI96972.1 hypothetical protein SAMN05421868_11411 [Paenibacillus naphthalenovorans]